MKKQRQKMIENMLGRWKQKQEKRRKMKMREKRRKTEEKEEEKRRRYDDVPQPIVSDHSYSFATLATR